MLNSRLWRSRRLQVALQCLAFGALAFGLKLWLIGAFGNATPFWDQWDAEAAWLYKPYLEGKLQVDQLFWAHNEHRIFASRVLALALLMATGVWDPLLQMAVNALLHVAATILFVYVVAPAAGRGAMPALLAFAAVLLGVPVGWENTLGGFQSSFYLLMLFSFAGMHLTISSRPLGARWWLGIVFCVLAFFSLASGVFAAIAAAAIAVAFHVLRVRRSFDQVLGATILAGIFVAGIALTPEHPGHEVFRAKSIGSFLGALIPALAWPLSDGIVGAVVRNAPMFAFLAWMAWKRPSAQDPRWVLAGLALWSLAQAAALAYGRSGGAVTSRYLDLHVIAILVGAASLLALANELLRGRTLVIALVVVSWCGVVIAGLYVYTAKYVPALLYDKRDTGRAQELNLREYLRTNDIANLWGKPHLHIPYPDAHRLADLLTSRELRVVLPANVRPPLQPESVSMEPEGAFVNAGQPPDSMRLPGSVLGSYGVEREAATGRAALRFPARFAGGTLAIPVTGSTRDRGIQLAMVQDERRSGLVLREDATTSWLLAHVPVGTGPFRIVVEDRSTTGWIAVGAPVLHDKVDGFVRGLLASYGLFVAMGLVLAGGLALAGGARTLAPSHPLLGAWARRVGARVRPRTLFAVAAAALMLPWLGSQSALALIALTAWHALLIALPPAAAIAWASRRGVRDPVVLTATGLVAGGLAAYAVFWSWLLNRYLGLGSAIAILAASALVAALQWRAMDDDARAALAPIRVAAFAWLASGLFLVAFALAPTGLAEATSAVAVRFSHELPIDNRLPFILAQQMTAGRIEVPMLAEWLSSDRPPLQSAYFLASAASFFRNAELHYQVQSTLLQALWILGMWPLLQALRVSRGATFLVLVATMLSPLVVIHGAYTWPKLFPIAYLGAITALLLHPERRLLDDPRVGALAGAGAALAMLCHGSSVFALLALGPVVLLARGVPGKRFIAATVGVGFAVLLTWSLYQGLIDPPGNRLLKWHLAGVIPVDSRSFGQALRESYAAQALSQIAAYKWSNFAIMFGDVADWGARTLRVLARGASPGDLLTVRAAQFFHVAAALGVLLIAPIALLAPRRWRRQEESRAAALLLGLSVLMLVLWGLLEFGPQYTVIHAGTLASVCFLYAAGLLALWSLSRPLAWLAGLTQMLLTFVLYAWTMPLTRDAGPDSALVMRSLNTVAVIAFAAAAWLAWRLCFPRAPVPARPEPEYEPEPEDAGEALESSAEARSASSDPAPVPAEPAPVPAAPAPREAPLWNRAAAGPRARWLSMAGLFAVFMVLLYTRRGDALALPQVWAEDGTVFLNGLIQRGWSTFLEPTNQYLIVFPRLLTALSLQISFSHYHVVSTVFAWVMVGLVALAVAVSPTRLRGRVLCALAIFAIPSDPEAFGLPLYTLWWLAVPLFLVAIWDETDPRPGWRGAFLVFGGLSSPVVLLVLPVLWYRARRFPQPRVHRVLALTGTVLALVQLFYILKSGGANAPALQTLLLNTIPNFVGRFAIGNFTESRALLWLAALAIIGLLAARGRRARHDPVFWTLAFFAAGAIALSVLRVDPAILHPRNAGPRYFFFPFVLTFWLIIHSYGGAQSRGLKAALASLGVLAVANALPSWSRTHEEGRWLAHVLSCEHYPSYVIPIQTDGRRMNAWSIRLRGEQCSALLDRDPLVSAATRRAAATFPFTVLPDVPVDVDPAAGPELVSTTVQGMRVTPSGMRVVGSYTAPSAGTGEIVLRVRRGDHLRYRSLSGASPGVTIEVVGMEKRFIDEAPVVADGWMLLEFSNATLPPEFLVRIRNPGPGAVAVRIR